MAERDIQWEIRSALGRDQRVVLWRNNVGKWKIDACPRCHVALRTEELRARRCGDCGATFAKSERRIVIFGLCVGSSDLVGILRGSGRWFCLEVKTDTGTTSTDQDDFIALIRGAGGFAAVVRSATEARDALERACAGERS